MMVNSGFNFIKIPRLMLSSATTLEMIVGISYVYWIIPQAHRIYQCSTSPGSIPRYLYLFLSQGKAVTRNDNKREILIYHNLVSTSIWGKQNMVGRDDDETSQDKDK